MSKKSGTALRRSRKGDMMIAGLAGPSMPPLQCMLHVNNSILHHHKLQWGKNLHTKSACM